MPDEAHAVGKCEQNHLGSYGYPTRPEEAYPFCSQCGGRMVWMCSDCGKPVPEDSAELTEARFCRWCGHPYFDDEAPVEGDQQ